MVQHEYHIYCIWVAPMHRVYFATKAGTRLGYFLEWINHCKLRKPLTPNSNYVTEHTGNALFLHVAV